MPFSKFYQGKEFFAAFNKANELGQTSASSLSGEFLASAGTMQADSGVESSQLDGNAMHQSIGNNIDNVTNEVKQSMNKVFDEAMKGWSDMETAYSKERPADYQAEPTDDLREKESVGFPLEDPDYLTKQTYPKF